MSHEFGYLSSLEGYDSSNKLQQFTNSFQSAKRKPGYTVGAILSGLLSMTTMDMFGVLLRVICLGKS
jgi:hypothetical protein